jgi:glycosyltransferase EpsF
MLRRVLHIVGGMDRAGAETMIMNLYREIDRSQIQFDFVFFSNKKGDYEDEIYELGGRIYRILESNPIKRTLALKNILKNHPEYKIVHSHTLLNSGLNLWAAKLAKVPKRIAHAHSTNDISNRNFAGKLYKNFSLKMINKYATHFIGCGQEASSFLFPKQNNVFILPNSIDIETFVSSGENNKEYINTEFNINNTVLKIIQVGRLQKVKNHKYSVKIARNLKDKGIKFKMFFIGQGELYNEIQEQINEQNLNEDVLLLGMRTDIPELMAGADVMLMPSLHEGFPVVLVESQAVGLRAIISNAIAKEVDLGLGLVNFENLERKVDVWGDQLVNSKSKNRGSREKRLNKLKEKGFDVKSSTQVLSNIYHDMK